MGSDEGVDTPLRHARYGVRGASNSFSEAQQAGLTRVNATTTGINNSNDFSRASVHEQATGEPDSAPSLTGGRWRAIRREVLISDPTHSLEDSHVCTSTGTARPNDSVVGSPSLTSFDNNRNRLAEFPMDSWRRTDPSVRLGELEVSNSTAMRPEDSTNGRSTTRPLSGARQAGLPRVDTAGTGVDTTILARALFHGRDVWERSSSFPGRRRRAIHREALVRDPTMRTPEDSHVSTSTGTVRPINSVLGSPSLTSLDNNRNRLVESSRPMASRGQTKVTVQLGELEVPDSIAMRPEDSTNGRSISRSLSDARQAGLPRVDTVGTGADTAELSRPVFHGRDIWERSSPFPGGRRRAIGRQALVSESTVHSPEDSHVSTSIAGIHPIDGLFGSSLSESRDSSDSRLAESPRTMPGLRQTGTTSGLGDLDTYSRRAVFASSAAHSRVPIVRAATAARTAASSSLAAPPPPTAGSSDGQQIIDLYRASRSLRSGRRASSARRNDATDTFSIDVPRSRMNAIGLRGGARTAHASNPLSRGGAGAGRALPNYGNIPQSSPVVRRTRRHSTLLDVSARLDAAATAIDAVEVGVRSASDSLDSLLHLLDSRLVSVVPSVADTRDTGEPYGVSMVPSPAAFGGGVDPRIGQDSRERAGETGLREFDQTGVATYRYSVDAVTGQLPTEEMCSEFSQGGKHSPQQEQDMSSVSGDSSTSPSSRPTLVSERTPRDGSDSVGYGISAGHLRITRAQPASTMRTATDILTSCEAESTGMPELPDADHQTGTAPILDTGPGVSSEIHATEGPTPASYLVRIATVAGDTNTGGGTALRRENPSRPTGRVVSLTPLAQDREAPAGDDVPGQPSRGGRPADDLAGTAGPFVNPPANPGDDVEGGWGNGAGRDRDNISIETVLRESEALIDRSSRVVAGIGVSVARRASSDAAVPPARVTRSLAMNTTDLLSTENRTEQVVAAVADVELESTLFAHANRIRTARRDVSDGSPREVEITAAMNGIDQERGRLMLEIARLRGQQNESLIQLLRLQQEQFLVRQRQVSTLSDIVDSFGRTVDAAWSLPHGEDSSLGRISGDVVSTLRRVLRVLLAAVPRVDSGSSAAPATADTLSIAGSSRLPAMNDPPRGDSEIPVTFPTLTVGSTLMPGSGIRSSANAIERGDIVRPVGDLTQEVIDAALAALPRLAAAASAISGARRLQGLQRNDGGRGEVDGVHDTGNRCSAETIAALPVAAAQSVGGCVICLTEGGAEAGTLCHLPCDHVFHRVCVGKWLRVQASCPTCRREVPNLEVDSTVIAVPVVPEV